MGAKDITEKILADFNDVFADIINGVLFDGKQVVSEHALENVKDRSQYKFNNKIHEQERDLAKRWIPYKICFALYGLEHETGAEPYMPMRIIGYDGAAYRGQPPKGNGTDQISPSSRSCCTSARNTGISQGLYTSA